MGYTIWQENTNDDDVAESIRVVTRTLHDYDTLVYFEYHARELHFHGTVCETHDISPFGNSVVVLSADQGLTFSSGAWTADVIDKFKIATMLFDTLRNWWCLSTESRNSEDVVDKIAEKLGDKFVIVVDKRSMIVPHA